MPEGQKIVVKFIVEVYGLDGFDEVVVEPIREQLDKISDEWKGECLMTEVPSMVFGVGMESQRYLKFVVVPGEGGYIDNADSASSLLAELSKLGMHIFILRATFSIPPRQDGDVDDKSFENELTRELKWLFDDRPAHLKN